MTYPRTLHLTNDGTPIVVQRATARAVATAARSVIGEMTMDDHYYLAARRWDRRDARQLAVVALADWIARELDLDDAATVEARRLAGRKGVPRG